MPTDFLYLFRCSLKPELWQLLELAAEAAAERGWQLFVVGGAVRDLLRAARSTMPLSLPLDDVDLVVDGEAQAVRVGAGVELAQLLQARYPQARLEVHGKFQTAALLWEQDPVFRSLWVDIATARTEVYPYPAANPEVSPSSIYADLYRRDFTVNAMAIRLTPPHAGELLDLMGGVQDLEAKYLRVLHPNSFIDDPTRIYRGVRFAARLGFQFEPQTEAYIREAIASGIYWQGDLQPDGSRIVAPALQTRLRAELMYLLRSPEWKVGLALLANLDALRCIHPTLTATPTLWRQLRHLDHYYHWFQRNAVDFPSSLWLARLEVILAQLAAGDRAPVAETLQLPLDSITRLHQLAAAEANISVVLLTCQHPSQIMGALCSYDRLLLGLVAIRSNRCLRRLISRYLGHWSAIKPLLDGNDLKALGYRPSPQFKQMLDKLTAATADGQVLTRADAEQFLCRNFPLSKY